jgi:hypothetical protein
LKDSHAFAGMSGDNSGNGDPSSVGKASAAVIAMVIATGDRLRPHEDALLQCVQRHRAEHSNSASICRSHTPGAGSGARSDLGLYYVTGTSGDSTVCDHELAHGMFHTTPGYREAALAEMHEACQ